MTNQAVEAKAIAIVDEFMDTAFDEQAEAAAWLVKRITDALEEAEKAGEQAALFSASPRRRG